MLVADSFVVLTFVYTAILMPMYPARIEVTPPIKKATVVYGLKFLSTAKNITNANPSKKKNRNLYSALRKVIAPYIYIIKYKFSYIYKEPSSQTKTKISLIK